MYTLMNKDNKMVDFEITGYGDLQRCRIINRYIELPLWIKDLDTWISNRSAAKHRAHIKAILDMCNANDMSGFISLTHCLSLNDTLWVKSSNENITWDKCNLYTNEFNSVISKLSFDGNGLYGMQVSTSSPELTTDGSFDKCWIGSGENIELIKAGSSGYQNSGREPYSEVLASPIFEELCCGIHYDLGKYNGRVVSKCKLFTTQKYGYKSYAEVYGAGDQLGKLMEIYTDIGAEDIFIGMILADCVTINPDRHYGNFGFAIDNDTLKVVGINRPFDYNLAMFPYADWFEGFDNMLKWQNERCPTIGTTYESAAESILTPRFRAQLINLKDLILTVDCDDKFTENRLKIVNRFKNIQIDRLLGNKKQFTFTDLIDKEGNKLRELFMQAQGNKRR